MAIIIKNAKEIALMRRSGRAAQKLLLSLGEAAQADVTPRELDHLAKRLLREAGARSPFLGKKAGGGVPYPAHITVSVNEIVVHGVPGDAPLQTGDIASLDVGVILGGFIGDTAGTFAVGEISSRAQRLMRVTREALDLGIKAARVGNTVGDIGHAVQSHVEGHGYGVVHSLVGHGVGRTMHEEPQVPNYGVPGEGAKLRAGMTIAVEPMVNEGTAEVKHLADHWTVATADGLLSAHYEHTIVILSDGPEILTCAD